MATVQGTWEQEAGEECQEVCRGIHSMQRSVDQGEDFRFSSKCNEKALVGILAGWYVSRNQLVMLQ